MFFLRPLLVLCFLVLSAVCSSGQVNPPDAPEAADVDPADAKELPSVAATGFAIQGKPEAADALTIMVEAALAERGFIVVDRRNLDTVLNEQAMSLGGIVDPSLATRIGKLSGARILVGGRLLETPAEMIMSLRLTSAESAEIKPASLTFPPATPLSQIAAATAAKVEELSKELTGLSEAGVDPQHAKAMDSLVALAHDRELPSIEIVLPEFHIARRIPDPAAETELMRLFQKLGFQVMKVKGSPQPADLRIEGEAFSELGMQAGQLISCRARVEIKLIDQASGQILFVDDEHASGVDVSESLAAKSALRNAGQSVSLRVAKFILNRP